MTCGLRRFVVGLGLGIAPEAPRRHVERPVLGRGQPAGLLDPARDGRAAVGVEPHDARGTLLGDEQARLGVEGHADRALEVARDDRPPAVLIEARDGAGLAIGDVHPILAIDRDAAQAAESVGPDLEGRDGDDGLGGGEGGTGDAGEEQAQHEGA